MTPLVWLFSLLTTKVQSMTGSVGDPIITENELITLAEHGEEEGTIEKDEREMIERVFSLNDLKAEDVMTPWGDVFSLQGDEKLNNVLGQLVAESYTRIPLFGDSPSDVRRILYLRDVLEALARGDADASLWDIAREPMYCPVNQPIDELLPILQKSKQHMAVVVDEHGAMQGVVTLEDLLEELVGEIYDESDEPPDEVMMLGDGGILVTGGAELRVVERHFDVDLPGKPTDTVSYWVLHHAQRIPDVDERFEMDGFEVVVQSASSSRIEQVILRALSKSPADDD